MTEPLFNLSNAQKEIFINDIEEIRNLIGRLNMTWWQDLKTKEPINRNVGELLMLCVSELSEALEGHRKGLMDDKLSQYEMFDVEIADTMIRLFDIAYHLCPNIGYILIDKLEYNANRNDHKPENRLLNNGKKY